MKFTDIYNNTNLSDQTDENTLFSGYDEIKMLSKKMGIAITKNCGIDKALSNVPTNLKDTVFRMNICNFKTMGNTVKKTTKELIFFEEGYLQRRTL